MGCADPPGGGVLLRCVVRAACPSPIVKGSRLYPPTSIGARVRRRWWRQLLRLRLRLRLLRLWLRLLLRRLLLRRW